MKRLHYYFMVIIPLFVLAACQTAPAPVSPTVLPTAPPTPASYPTNDFEGLWQTEGYGQVYEIEGDQFQIYAVTAVTCTPTLSGQKRSEEWLDIHFLEENGVATIGVELLPGETPDEKRLIVDGIASQQTVRRLTEWPETCQQPTPNTPLNSFDAFWQMYDEHYPFFAMKGIDWQATRDQYRPQISDSTTDEDLFAILSAMIAPLEDAHTWIQPIDIDDSFEGQRPDPNPLTKADWQRTAEIVEGNYLETAVTTYLNDELAFGYLPNQIGYLRINGFNDYATDGSFWTGLDDLETALDDIFSQPMNGLIIDIRPNDGGSDKYGLAVANRLSQTPYHAFTIQARNNPTDPNQWTEGQPIFVQPTDRPSYDGPVVLLTSRYTVSAAETFTMALMGRTPEVTRIGENTQGVFAVVLVHILPNGWWFGLQNERFLTEDGTTFDGPGIPPHIALTVFPQDELTAGQDSALESALDLLSR